MWLFATGRDNLFACSMCMLPSACEWSEQARILCLCISLMHGLLIGCKSAARNLMIKWSPMHRRSGISPGPHTVCGSWVQFSFLLVDLAISKPFLRLPHACLIFSCILQNEFMILFGAMFEVLNLVVSVQCNDAPLSFIGHSFTSRECKLLWWNPAELGAHPMISISCLVHCRWTSLQPTTSCAAWGPSSIKMRTSRGSLSGPSFDLLGKPLFQTCKHTSDPRQNLSHISFILSILKPVLIFPWKWSHEAYVDDAAICFCLSSMSPVVGKAKCLKGVSSWRAHASWCPQPC